MDGRMGWWAGSSFVFLGEVVTGYGTKKRKKHGWEFRR